MIVLGGWGAWGSLITTSLTLALIDWLPGDQGRVTSVLIAMVGASLFTFGQFLHDHDVEEMFDPVEGTRVVVRNKHHFFWIPIRWWGALLAASGVAGAIFGV